MEPIPQILHFDMQLLIQIVPQFVSIAIVIAVLSFILYKPVRDFLDNRKKEIADQIAVAEQLEEMAQSGKALYESKLQNIEAERSQILESARKRAYEKEQKILSQAAKEVEELRRRARRDVQREKEKAQDEMKAQMIQISTLMATRYVSMNMDAAAHNKLLNEVISELGEVKCLS